MLGVFVGDAAGAPIEFRAPSLTTADELVSALSMGGGGVLDVGKGQITDDGELTLALASTLADGEFHVGWIEASYLSWFYSDPFDIGRTIRAALGGSHTRDLASQSNGALMRVAPLGIHCTHDTLAELVRKVTLECSITHPNRVAVDCNILYCLAIGYLQRRQYGCIEYIDDILASGAYDFDETVVSWYYDSLHFMSHNVHKQQGWVRHGFTLAFYFLRRGASFYAAITTVLSLGGDTDTNAAIVGGLLGAYHGPNGIPRTMREPVLAFDCTTPDSGYTRPARYSVKRFFDSGSPLAQQPQRDE